MKKTILAMLFAVALTVILLPGTALAADGDFVIFGDTLREYNGPGGDVVIPDGVTVIESAAFKDCTSLTGVTIPDSVTSIDSMAFYRCTSLTDVTIGDGVETIGNSAFNSCTSLTSVTIGDGVTNIGKFAFYSCTNLTSVTIPDSVTSIGNGAFEDCTSLTSVDIPGSVTYIGNSAFTRCTSLTSVDIPDGVTYIGDHAFYSCTSLTSVVIPDSVTYIGDQAFRGCTSLASAVIPGSVTNIGQYTFTGCTSLTSVDIPDGVTYIGNFAFWSCTSLTSVTIPGSVTSTGDYAFEDCTALTSVTILDGVTLIGTWSFKGCTSLTSVVIPASVRSIGNAAFWQCENLDDVYYGGSEEQWKTTPGGRNDPSNVRLFPSLREQYPGQFDFEYGGVKPATMHYYSLMADVKTSDYFAAPVSWALGKGVTNGTGNNHFSPKDTCTEVQILTMLYRAAGSPTTTAAAPIPVASYFQDAVNWAYEQGMIDDNFNPDAPCTRASAVTYIWLAFGSPDAPASSFSDVSAGEDCAAAVNWAVANGVTNGTGDGSTFSPGKTCMREEIVTFLHRAYVPSARL